MRLGLTTLSIAGYTIDNHFSIPRSYTLTWNLISWGLPEKTSYLQSHWAFSRKLDSQILDILWHTPLVKLIRKGLKVWFGLWTKQNVYHFDLAYGKIWFPDWNKPWSVGFRRPMHSGCPIFWVSMGNENQLDPLADLDHGSESRGVQIRWDAGTFLLHSSHLL